MDAGAIDANTTQLDCDDPGAEPCPDNGVCFNGECALNACLLEANFCEPGELCAMDCVPVGDPCLTVECGDGFTCYQGSCVAGCFPPSPCLGVVCGEDQFCDGGSCFDLNPCDGLCPAGEACNTYCRPISPCSGVVCEENELCVTGACQINPCFGIDCADGAICVNGTCLDTCDGCDCQPYEDCVFGNCVCTPDCAGKACGDDDGCGGLCNVCPVAGELCDTGTGVCSCDASCSGKDCGELNGCGDPCVTNSGCQGAATCDNGDPTAPTCVCQAAGVEICDDNDCCNASQDCIDTDGLDGTDRCCTTANICAEATNDQCCNNSQACVTGFGCCNNNDTCEDTGGNCLCGSGQIAINCSNTNVGDEFCCASGGRACEQADAALDCCPNNQLCFDSNDSGTEDDTCCTAASWCDDRQSCCNFAIGEVCFNDDDNNPDNDTCCAPTCAGKSCGDDDGCGGRCDVESCGAGQTCLASGPDYSCQDDLCNPQCNPCSEICLLGSCQDKCPNGDLDPLTCQCGGGID